METTSTGGSRGQDRPASGGDRVWVVSPHNLVSQAVVTALATTGAPAEFHPWESLFGDLRRPAPTPEVRLVLVVLEGAERPRQIDEIGHLVARGGVRVAVVTTVPEALWWGAILHGTAVDVVSMTTSVDQLAHVVRRLAAGESLMDPERRQALISDLFESLDKRRHLVSRLAELSRQQQRVLELLASGRRVAEVAEVMGIADATARSHVKTLRHKLGARTQLEAVAMLRQVREVGEHIGPEPPRPRGVPVLTNAVTASLGFSP